MEKVPEQFQGFVKDKQVQLLNNVLTSAAAGLVLSNGVSLIAGAASVDVVVETTKAIVPVFAVVALASFATTFDNKE